MKNILPQISLFVSTLLLSLSIPAQASAAAAKETAATYTLDPAHTSVLWHVNHFGFSNPSGKWMAEGTLVLDQAKPKNSKVNATIHMDTLDTGVAKLDEHLKSKDFFDVVQFPTATFVSDKVDVTGKDTAKVHGTLTLHGVSKPVVLDVKLNKIGQNPITEKDAVGFSAKTKINRSEFGMTTLIPGISDAVTIDIESEAAKNDVEEAPKVSAEPKTD